MNPIADEHHRRNRTTLERWDTMASHRARVMQMLRDARGATGESLCLLGAGNGNDVDLAQLADDFQQIVLVDLDEQALAKAVARLPAVKANRVVPHGEVDLSGLLPTLTTWQGGRTPSDTELTAAIQAASAAPLPDVGTFDVVASTCVLTQLIDSIYLALATDHPRCVELVLAVRNRHLQTVYELLKPGGAGIVITDFISTETAPEIAQLNETQFPIAAESWIQQGNFFTGANPLAIRDYYRTTYLPTSRIKDLQLKNPWRWDIGAKQFAVAGVTFRGRE